MRFDYAAYEKVFPAQPQPQPQTDSAVDDYHPTDEEAKASGVKVESAVEVEDTRNKPQSNAQPAKMDENPNNGINDHEGGKTSAEGEIQP